MKILIFLIIALSFGCNSNNEMANIQDKSDSLRNSLIGKWGGPGEDSPVFEIKTDSIHYFQRETSYSYRITNHDMVIKMPTLDDTLGNIYVMKDTLFFLNEVGVLIRAVRFK